MRLLSSLVCMLALLIGTRCFAIEEQTKEAEIPRYPIYKIVTDIPRNMKDWWNDTFTKDNVPSLMALGGITGMMVMTDYETWQAVKRPFETNDPFRHFAEAGESFSKGPFQYVTIGGFMAAGIFDRRALRTSFQIVEGIVSSGLIVQVLKHTTGRQSPFKSTSRTGRWRLLPSQVDYSHNTQEYDAMPSGHLQSFATSLFIIMENYPEQTWMKYLAYPAIGWVCFGLVGTGIHWWSDFPISIALSYSFAKVITRRNHPKKDQNGVEKTSAWPTILPTMSYEGEPLMSAHWSF